MFNTKFIIISESVSCPPGGSTIEEGDVVSLECSVGYIGYKAPRLQWYYDQVTPITGKEVIGTDFVR